jgi:hypothetical protein
MQRLPPAVRQIGWVSETHMLEMLKRKVLIQDKHKLSEEGTLDAWMVPSLSERGSLKRS